MWRSRQHQELCGRGLRSFAISDRLNRATRLNGHYWDEMQCSYRRFFAAIADKQRLRNVAIIAHVDHGKTSLVDKLLTQSGSLDESLADRAMVCTFPILTGLYSLFIPFFRTPTHSRKKEASQSLQSIPA